MAADVLSCSPAIAEALINKRPKFTEQEEPEDLQPVNNPMPDLEE